MAEITPFRALRFTVGAGPISELVCPPCGSIRSEQELLEKNPHNMVHLEPENNSSVKVAETLHSWEKNGTLKQDSTPAVFLYEDEFTVQGQTRKVRGILCRVKLEDYKNNVILPRSETLYQKTADLFDQMKETLCNVSPIYSLYRDDDRVTAKRMEVLSSFKPRYAFTADGVTRRVWVVSDPVAINAFREDFAERKLFLAEGHHRYEASLRFRDWCRQEHNSKEGNDPDYVLMALTDMESSALTVLPTYRLLNGLKDFSANSLFAYCRQYFDVIERDNINDIKMNLDALYRQAKTAFACYCGGKSWTLLILKDYAAMAKLLPGKSEPFQNSDAVVLNSLIFERGLGITAENEAQQGNLEYTGCFEQAISCVKDGSKQCAFFMNPARVKLIVDIVSAGELMPPKCASFYPQPVAGLVMNKINP